MSPFVTAASWQNNLLTAFGVLGDPRRLPTTHLEASISNAAWPAAEDVLVSSPMFGSRWLCDVLISPAGTRHLAAAGSAAGALDIKASPDAVKRLLRITDGK